MTTNQTNKKKSSAARKLIPAVGMLTASAMMLASSTYAWFTMNREVTVTGMTMKTKVGGNLLVTGDNVEANYTSSMSQIRAALLEPVSTVSAVDGSFFYTVDAKANGDANDDVYVPYDEKTALTGDNYADKVGTDWTRSSTGAAKAKYDADFNGTDGYKIVGSSATPAAAYANAYGYVDYTFYLKATSDTDNQQIRLTECNLVRNNLAITDPTTPANDFTDDDLAWRVAIFAENITESNPGNGTETDAVTATDDSAKIILTRPNAANQSDTGGKNYAVSDDDAAPTAMSLNYNAWASNNAYIDQIATAGSTAYYKVVARVWLEGEDVSCKSSTYARLTSDYEFGSKAKT